MGRNTVKFAIAGTVVVLALVYLGWQGVNASAAHTISLSQLLENSDQYDAKRVEVGGLVVPGSITGDPRNLEFRITEQNQIVSVRYVGTEPVPDGLYAEDAQATVKGVWRHGDCVEATHIQTKCSSKYGAAPDLEG